MIKSAVKRHSGEKLRVGFASVDNASSEKTWSGTPLNILSRLQAHPDLEVDLVTPLRTTLKWLYLPYKVIERLTKKNFIWYIERPSLKYFARQVEAAWREKKLDVIFSTSSIPGAMLHPAIPSVFWTDAVWHGMEGYYPGLFSNLSKATSKAGRHQEETALRRAQFACYSSDWAASFARQLTDPERVKVIPYGPNLSITHTRSDVERWVSERRVGRPNECTLLFVGKDWERKGGNIAVKAASLLNQRGIATTLRVVGCQPTEPTPNFVEVIGFVDKTEPNGARRIAEIYSSSDLFILPSHAEAYGIVFPEAAAFGLPILTCDTGGMGECVLNNVNGFRLRVEDDGSGFAKQADLILRDYTRFALNSYSQYESRLNWDSSVGQLVDLLKRAAASVDGRSGKR